MILMDDIYASFINLDHRTDRLNHMEGELKNISLKVVRTRGIPWKEIPLTQDTYVMQHRTPGAIGCHYSQVSVMREAKSQGKHALVMEDDIHFCQDFNSRFMEILDWQSKNEWDVFWLGASFHVNPPYWHKVGQSGMPPDCSAQLGYDAKCTSNPRIMRTYGAYITFAYMVNFNSMDRIFSLFDENLKYSIGIDWLFIKLQPQLKCFCYVPGLVMQIDNMSDIGSGMTVWSGQLNNGPYVFQERKEDFNPETFNWAECR